MEELAGNFGKNYTDRNAISLPETELSYKELYGITRTGMNRKFLGGFDRGMRVLEVDSNVGNQLLCLQNDGSRNLYGIQLRSYAVELSKSRTKGINIIQGSAFDIPFKDGFLILFLPAGFSFTSPQGILTRFWMKCTGVRKSSYGVWSTMPRSTPK